ncbi:MAG: viral A-type inclusion protein [Bacteroidaceae bacterium]|nr:viral A-type inclusion protein [Bacteroidaceae bacterium]
MSKPVEIEFLAKDSLTPTMDKVGSKTDALSESAKKAEAGYAALQNRMVELRGNIALLESKLEDLRLAGEVASPDLDQTENIANINALERQIEGLKAELKELQAVAEQVEVAPPSVEPTQRKFNGLHNSIQQMAREMPSLAMGPQTFFLAISNNLPVFTDEVARAKKEFNMLTQAGQKATPVWKQILSSLFSWQTALTTGIMLLVMYGDEIVDWVGSLFKGEKQLTAAERAQRGLNDAIKENGYGIGDTIVTVRKLSDEWAALGGNLKEQQKFIEDNKDEFNKLGVSVSSVNDAENLLVSSTPEFLEAMRLRAEASAASKLAAEEYEKALIKERELESIEKTKTSFIPKTYGFQGTVTEWQTATYANPEYTETNNEAKTARETADAYYDKAKALELAAAAKLKEARITEVDEEEDDDNESSRILTEKEFNDRLLELRRQNQQDDIDLQADGTKKKLAQIEHDYNIRKAEIERLEADFKAFNKDKGLGNVLTAEQQNEINRANENNTLAREQQIQEVYDAEREAMREYLKEYGTFQQQKLAIAEEYAERILQAERAGDTGEANRLRRQQASEIQAAEIANIKAEIDWQGIFGGLGGLLEEQLKPTLEKLKQYAGSDDFREASLQDQQIVYDLIADLEARTTGGLHKEMFSNIARDMKAYQQSLRELNTAKEREREAADALVAAQERLRQAQERGNATEITQAEDEVAAAQTAFNEAAENVQTFSSANKDAAEELRKSSNNATTSLQGLSEGLQGLRSGSLAGIGAGLGKLGDVTKNLSGTLGTVGQTLAKTFGSTGDPIGMIVSAILSLLDILKDGIGGLLSDIINLVFEAINGILEDILSGGIITKVGGALVDGIAGLFDTITFGGFSSWIDDGNAKEVAETINRLTARNEALQTSIEDLTDEIVSSKGTISVNAYRKAIEYQKENNQNYLDIAKAQAGYHGSHHSWNYYWGGFSKEQIADFSNQIGRNWDGSIWSLTPEEMKLLRGNVDMWTQIQSTGKGNYGGRLTERLDDYIDQAGKLEELTNQLYEGLTAISFDGVYDSFVDSLMNMKYSAKDAAEDISEYFMRAMLSNKIGELYADKLEEWWQDFGKAMEDGTLDEKEREELLNRYLGYIDEAAQLRDDIAAATGYTGDGGSTQSGKSGAFSQSITYDQGAKLEGLFTSGQMHWASIDDRMENVSDKMNTAENHLAKIEENTGNCVKELKEIKDEVKKQNRDGVKVK